MIIAPGSTDITTYFKLVDPASGVPETGLTITDLDATYVRDRATAVKNDLTALVAADSAHADNKAFEVSSTNAPGLYRVDWPDAAFAAGVARVQLVINGAAIDPAVIEVELATWVSYIGTPVALDGGSATLASMLTKIADDNGGADFDATTDSLTEIVDGIATDAEIADAVHDEVVDTHTLRELLSLMAAALCGKASGGGTATVTFRNTNDSANRIVATVDANGNRTAVTLTPV